MIRLSENGKAGRAGPKLAAAAIIVLAVLTFIAEPAAEAGVWSEPVNISGDTIPYSYEYPQIALAPSGNPHVT